MIKEIAICDECNHQCDDTYYGVSITEYYTNPGAMPYVIGDFHFCSMECFRSFIDERDL